MTSRWVLCLVLTAAAGPAAARMADGKHNLSVSGPGKVRSSQETQVCVFCHIPHDRQAKRALWARPLENTRYIPYESSTMSQPVGQPDGASKQCLSCHDGTIAVSAVRGRKVQMSGLAAGGVLPAGPDNLGVDLRDDHPVSMPIPRRRPEVHAPHGTQVRLDDRGEVQCTSCHDPHEQSRDPRAGAFLTADNARSAICLACHTPRYWATLPAAHQSSEAPFRPEDGNHTPYTTVAETACESCHRPHGAAHAERNLKGEEEATCLACHAGRVAKGNVLPDFQKPYSHPTLRQTPSVHDAAEGPRSPRAQLPERSPAAPRHAECPDCHEPHAATHRPARAPFASGALAGVWGIDRFGNRVDEARFQYEVCFKCHGDSANQPSRLGRTSRPFIRRQVAEYDLRLVFDPQGPSAHPVVGPGRNPLVPGLAAGLSPASQIACTDCHSSESGSGAPHGSAFASLLARNYVTDDFTPESPQAYALCYGCHDRAVLLSRQSGFPEHERHVAGQRAPCSACHDAHGVSAERGDPTGNAHLVNFDLAIVGATAGLPVYRSAGPGRGSCTLTCHGHVHADAAYPQAGVELVPRARH